jgi:hypothetical protein
VLDGYASITLSKRGGYFEGQELAWLLNQGDGIQIDGVGTYFAEMGFKVVRADPGKHEGKYRVTTLRYRYKLRAPDGEDMWRVHWHPDGESSFREPHLHMRPNLKVHFAVQRVTFEQTIQWCMQLGAPLTCTPEEAKGRLDETEWTHVLYRSWSTSPGERTRG